MSSSESDSEHLSFDHVPRDSTQNLSSFSYVEVDNSSSEETGDAEMSSISIRSTTSWGSSNSNVDVLLNNSFEEPNYVSDDSNSSSECSLFSPLQEIKPHVLKHNYWSMTKELYYREIGKYKNNTIWSNKFYQSLVGVQKLKLSRLLKKHKGCVNALDFNMSCNLLLSGSDDCKICLWDWSTGNCLFKYNTLHKRNIFQTKFLSAQRNDHKIISCSRDGSIVLSHMSDEGYHFNKVIASHSRSCNKLAVHPDEPHIVLSCGEDGIVKNIDIREAPFDGNVTISNILHQKYYNGTTMHLYGIDINPLNTSEFILNGDDEYVRLYDKRNISSEPIKQFCSLLPKSRQIDDEFNDSNSNSTATTFDDTHITSAVYNYCGTEILASYSDDDIYLFDVNGCSEIYLHQYSGHLNSATVKGVNFYGPKSDYVMSGSDCGHIFIWDKKSEAIVLRKHADAKGAVNVLEGHPFMPILATSGLDNTIKIWEPLNIMQKPNKKELRMSVVENTARRQREYQILS